jgi:hypothetical protein
VQLVNMGGAVTDGGPGTMSRLGAWITIVKCNWGIGMMAMPFMLHSAGKHGMAAHTHPCANVVRDRREGAEVRCGRTCLWFALAKGACDSVFSS